MSLRTSVCISVRMKQVNSLVVGAIMTHVTVTVLVVYAKVLVS